MDADLREQTGRQEFMQGFAVFWRMMAPSIVEPTLL